MLQKQPIDISFAQGLDTKTDPKRVPIGKFVKLENSVFTKGGLLQKRNGFGQISALPPAADTTYLTTFNGNLTAIGNQVWAYSESNASWVGKGALNQLKLNTLPLIRNNFNQVAADTAVSANGLICTAYVEYSGSAYINKFSVADVVTGQNIVAPQPIPVTSGTVNGGMRVYYLDPYFIILFTNTISGVQYLQYVTVNVYNYAVGTNTTIAAGYTPSSGLNYDAAVVNGNLYIAYYTTSGGNSVKVTYLSSQLNLVLPYVISGTATLVSLATDPAPNQSTLNYIFVTYYDIVSKTAYNVVLDQNLKLIIAPTQLTGLTGQSITNIASVGADHTCYIFTEVFNSYGINTLPTYYVQSQSVAFEPGGFYLYTSTNTNIRSLGLASKPFIVNGNVYYLGAYQSGNNFGLQPTGYQSSYFLVNATASSATTPSVVARLAFQNGFGYCTRGVPNVSLYNNLAFIPYLYADLITPASKGTNVPAGTQTSGIYAQFGVNVASFLIDPSQVNSVEIGKELYVSGGFIWSYDGYHPVEQNFLLYPDIPNNSSYNILIWSTTGGSMKAQPDGITNVNAYYYQFVYEWTDNQGNIIRSAPSIPLGLTTTGSSTTGAVNINVPTLRVTMRSKFNANPVKIVIYRWSVAQQQYYQITSVTQPLINDTTVDYVSYTDTLSDASILGNSLIYTTGGVVEDMNGPASNILTTFDTRLWLVDSEDQNLLWYSKQVIEGTPVELSDLFTYYVPPTTSVGGSTGPITALSPMDDKLIIFKENAIYYISGSGPDNTGANNQYTQVIFVTSTVGCTNERSIVLTPAGLMFQSNKGIWLLGRDLSTQYIGAPVEDLTAGQTVTSALNIPETNQVRFALTSGLTVMFDYYYSQWGSFSGISNVSGTVYQDLHTFIDSYGGIYQETPGQYLDGPNPVLMNFRTGPIRLGELQNYQRAYFFYLLGDYLSPHKLYVQLSYDYDVAPSQSFIISPSNYSPPYGTGNQQNPYGQQLTYGGSLSLENWRVFLQKQRCMAFAIEMQEVFDPTFGAVAGAGLTLSGLNVICGFKSGFRPQPAATSIG